MGGCTKARAGVGVLLKELEPEMLVWIRSPMTLGQAPVHYTGSHSPNLLGFSQAWWESWECSGAGPAYSRCLIHGYFFRVLYFDLALWAWEEESAVTLEERWALLSGFAGTVVYQGVAREGGINV